MHKKLGRMLVTILGGAGLLALISSVVLAMIEFAWFGMAPRSPAYWEGIVALLLFAMLFPIIGAVLEANTRE
jgi:hypothetical protein